MKTHATNVPIETFLEGVSDKRRKEAYKLIALMQGISSEKPYMYGPSIIGFGTQHYKYESGVEGDMPLLAFSPRKASLTIYFEGFDKYEKELKVLGKHKTSVACLYVNKLEDIDMEILKVMRERSFKISSEK